MTIEKKPAEQRSVTGTPSETEVRDSGCEPVRLYVQPAIISHSGEEALAELGPAQACYPFNSCGVTP